jgi:hypothetical protein
MVVAAGFDREREREREEEGGEGKWGGKTKMKPDFVSRVLSSFLFFVFFFFII